MEDAAPERKHVLLFARKILLRNTRIFKQVKSLNRAGYHVTLVGILPVGGLEYEEQPGCTIYRLRLDPLYARVPRRMRRTAFSVHRSLASLPARYVRATRPLRVLRGRLGRRLGPVWRFLTRPLDGSLDSRLAGLEPRRTRIALLPLVFLSIVTRVVVKVSQPVGRVAGRPLRAWRRRSDPERRRRSVELLRRLVRTEERMLRALVEFLIDRFRVMTDPFILPLRSVEYYKLADRLARELPPPDVVHANDLDTLFVAARVARRHRVPLVYDAQELYTGLHTLPGWYRRLLAVQERLLIRRADRITVVNDAIADVMEKRYGVHVDAVVLNCPPLPTPREPGTYVTLRDLLELPPDVLVLLYSGALTPNRGLLKLLLALEQLAGVHLAMLGEGPLQTELEEFVAARGLGERVSFVPFVHHLDVPAFIASADIGVIPYEHVGLNHYLASPSKLFHYMIAGLPVVCSDFPFLRKVVVDNGIGRVFDPADPASIAASVRELIPLEVRADCKARLTQIAQTYSWDEQERRFLAVYGSLERSSVRAGRLRTSLGYSGHHLAQQAQRNEHICP